MTAQVDAVVYFYIQDPIASILQAENARNSTFRVAQGTLRDVLGTKSLAQILSDREEISEQMGVGMLTLFLALVVINIESLLSDIVGQCY